MRNQTCKYGDHMYWEQGNLVFGQWFCWPRRTMVSVFHFFHFSFHFSFHFFRMWGWWTHLRVCHLIEIMQFCEGYGGGARKCERLHFENISPFHWEIATQSRGTIFLLDVTSWLRFNIYFAVIVTMRMCAWWESMVYFVIASRKSLWCNNLCKRFLVTATTIS